MSPPPRNLPPPLPSRSAPAPRADVAARGEALVHGELELRESAARSELASRTELEQGGPERTDDPTPRSEPAPRSGAAAHLAAQVAARARSEATARSEASTLPPLSKRGRGPGAGDTLPANSELLGEQVRPRELDGTHAATSFVPIAVAKQPERRVSRWVLGALAAAVLAPAAFWMGESLSNLRAARRAHAAGNLESRTAALDVAPTLSVSTRVEPASAEIWLDRHPVATGQLGIVLPKDGSTHELRVAANGYIPVTLLFADVPPPRLIRLEALPVGAALAAGGGTSDSASTGGGTSEAKSGAASGASASSGGASGTATSTPAPSSEPAAPLAAVAPAVRRAEPIGARSESALGSDAPAPAATPPRARPAARASSPPPKRRPPAAAPASAETPPDPATPAPEVPAPQVQIIDEGGPKVRVIE